MADVTISTIYEFIEFVLGSNRGTSDNYITVKLTQDLDFNSITETDYLQYKTQFNGDVRSSQATWYMYFDGSGHTVSNISYIGSSNWQLFKTVAGGIYNITLRNMNLQCATFYGFCSTTGNTNEITDCHTNGKIICTGNYYGISQGGTNKKIEQCSSSGEIQCVNFYGISASGDIKRCCVSGKIKATNIYLISYNSNYTYCWNCWVKNITLKSRDGTGIPSRICFTSRAAYTSYAVIDNAADLQAAGYTNSTFFPSDNIACFYANDEWTGGNCGTASTNLKSRGWLRDQGWAI